MATTADRPTVRLVTPPSTLRWLAALTAIGHRRNRTDLRDQGTGRATRRGRARIDPVRGRSLSPTPAERLERHGPRCWRHARAGFPLVADPQPTSTSPHTDPRTPCDANIDHAAYIDESAGGRTDPASRSIIGGRVEPPPILAGDQARC